MADQSGLGTNHNHCILFDKPSPVHMVMKQSGALHRTHCTSTGIHMIKVTRTVELQLMIFQIDMKLGDDM